MKKLIIPAILSSTFEDYSQKIKAVEGLVERVQIDVMDNRFVPNKTIPFDSLAAVKSGVYKEAHMMVDAPCAYIPAAQRLGVGTYIFHVEACSSPKLVYDIIERIRQYKMQPSIAINPRTPLKAILPYLSQLEHVLVMTVVPGFGGQSFIPSALRKVQAIRKRFPSINIEVDGGINADTLPKANKAGANYFVMGNAIYKQPDIGKAVADYRRLVKE
ncbi:ribulose-phosphate 3-epimerase [Candidatus Woesearchaeota archaeon]|nr:ribulose-phosphate 3-epimerase [Candidatus Woesearchaeota archaeon]